MLRVPACHGLLLYRRLILRLPPLLIALLARYSADSVAFSVSGGVVVRRWWALAVGSGSVKSGFLFRRTVADQAGWFLLRTTWRVGDRGLRADMRWMDAYWRRSYRQAPTPAYPTLPTCSLVHACLQRNGYASHGRIPALHLPCRAAPLPLAFVTFTFSAKYYPLYTFHNIRTSDLYCRTLQHLSFYAVWLKGIARGWALPVTATLRCAAVQHQLFAALRGASHCHGSADSLPFLAALARLLFVLKVRRLLPADRGGFRDVGGWQASRWYAGFERLRYDAPCLPLRYAWRAAPLALVRVL